MRKVFGLIFLVSIITITMIFIFSRLTSSGGGHYEKSCDTDADCEQGKRCEFDPDYNKKICTTGKYCSMEPGNLTECSTDKDCLTCINDPAYTCVVVDADHPYKIKQGDNIINIPDSNQGKGWCLLPFKPSIKCNSLTSDTILTEGTDSSGKIEYQWSCLCKFPDLVTQYPGGDCDIEVACGVHAGLGSLYVPDGSTTACNVDDDCAGKNICYKDDNKCYKDWNTDKDVDPTKGICICNKGLKYIGTDQYKMCLPDGCAPHGKSDGQGGCICDKPAGQQGYLACPNEISNMDMKHQCKDSPACLPDPCWPGGTADQTGIGCNCGDGYIPTFTPGSPTQYTCTKACGPTVCGTRGKCIVTGTGIDKKEECTGCVCPYTNEGDQTNMCNVNNGKFQKGSACHNRPEECCSGICEWDISDYVCK